MQAHQLSSTAARNLNPSGSLFSISDSLATTDGRGLAHDAGNLLGALGLYCDLLDLPGVLRPEHLHYARELRLLSQRSGELIKRLLEGGRGPIGSVARVRPRRLCPATVVKAFAPLLRSLAAPEATMSFAVANGLPILPFASEILERILVNLTRNAATALLTHVPLGLSGLPDANARHIHIAVCGNATNLRLTIIDNGPGMPENAAAAFLRPEPLAKGAMCGIGHHVIHDLLESTRGVLSIEVVPDRGTTVQIDWPVAAAKRRTGAIEH